MFFFFPSFLGSSSTLCGHQHHVVSMVTLCMFFINYLYNIVKESDSDTIIMVIFLVVGVGGIFILFAIMALCYRLVLYCHKGSNSGNFQICIARIAL